MGQLHELLAAEPDLEAAAKKIIEEAKHTFGKKTHLFFGMTKTLESLNSDYDYIVDGFTPEKVELEETVPGKLAYTRTAIEKYWDAVFQKELTNQTAKGTIEIDGVALIEDAPVTWLLGMERKLKHLREMFATIKTLEPGVKWEDAPDAGEHVYKRAEPEIKFKTKKVVMHTVLYKATDKHPAQIEKWNEDKEVGKYTVNTWCGYITPARKSELLGRIDKLLIAVKQARMRANKADVQERKVGKTIMDYILG